MTTSTALRTAQALSDLLADLPPSTSDRDRRMRGVLRLAASALREGRPVAEVAEDACREVYGFCCLPVRGGD